MSVDTAGCVRDMTSKIWQPDTAASMTAHLTFGRFGAPVTVAAPPASQVWDAAKPGWVVSLPTITWAGMG
jgi:hypothetical protein